MITLIIGNKGSGKQRLIQLANEAVEKSDGNVVVIERAPSSPMTFPTKPA